MDREGVGGVVLSLRAVFEWELLAVGLVLFFSRFFICRQNSLQAVLGGSALPYTARLYSVTILSIQCSLPTCAVESSGVPGR